jgi:hypothetical protein
MLVERDVELPDRTMEALETVPLTRLGCIGGPLDVVEDPAELLMLLEHARNDDAEVQASFRDLERGTGLGDHGATSVES